MIPRSIRGRMLALSALATVAALVLAGLVILGVLGGIVTQGLDRRLDAQIALLASAVSTDGTIDDARLAATRGALEAGPGWRWEIASPKRTVRSADFPLLDAGPPGPEHARHRSIGPYPREGREPGGAPVHARAVTLPTSGGEVRLSSTAPRSVIERPIRDAALPLLALLAILSLLLAAAGLVQVTYGLRPLRALRDAVAGIRSGRMREVPEDQPVELRPLAEELNALARETHAALATARASAANLAHALKTPVATLALELRDDADRMRQVARIEATIRHHLSRARDQVTVDRHARTAIGPALADLTDTVRRLTPGKSVFLEQSDALTESVSVDPADFDEILGNLLENAARHAHACVRIRAWGEGKFLRVAIEDDGPGIPAEAVSRALQPGVRLDERGEGHGFGLAIASDLAALYGGRLALDASSHGGLAACVWLPLSLA